MASEAGEAKTNLQKKNLNFKNLIYTHTWVRLSRNRNESKATAEALTN